MEYKTVKLRREELYEQVWSQPMSRLARTYGLSDVGLAKICRKFGIPRPIRGYWQRKLTGKRVRQTPLPPPRDQADAIIYIRVANRLMIPVELKQSPEADALIVFEQSQVNRILVAPELLSPHPEVAKAERSLRHGRRNGSGILVPRAKGRLDISVGPESLNRALRVIDALIKALEARGFQLSVSETDVSSTRVSVLGETIHFGLEERLNRTKRPTTLAQKRYQEKNPWSRMEVFYDYSPSGNLVLKIKDSTYGSRRQWSDGKRRQIENSLNVFIIGLIKTALNLKAERLEQERRQREREEEHRRYLERERLRREEEARLQSLENQITAWNKSQRIRIYLEAVRQAAIRKYGQIPSGSKLEGWLAWAEKQADRLDPLIEVPPSHPVGEEGSDGQI